MSYSHLKPIVFLIFLLPNILLAQNSDLSITISANNTSPQIGNKVTFTLTAKNTGLGNDTNVTVNAPIPAGFLFDSATGGTYDSSTGVWSIGSLNSNATTTIQIIGTAVIVGDTSFDAEISGDNIDSNTTNNTAGQNVTISCSQDLRSETTTYTGVQANWKLDGNTDDSSGNAHNAKNGTAPTGYSTDFLEGTGTASAQFDGSNVIKYNDGTFLNSGSSTISIAGWIKPSNLTGKHIIFDEGGGGNGFTLWMNSKKLTLSTANGGSRIDIQAANDLQKNVWQHVAGVFDNGTLKVYLNGIENFTTAGYSSISNHGNDGGLGGELGNTATNTSVDNFIGLLDAFVYSNTKAFSAANIKADAVQQCKNVLDSDLSISGSVNDNTPEPNSNVIFTLTAENTGPDNNTSATVDALLPDGYTFVSATPSSGTYDSSLGTWSIGNLSANATATLDITATVQATGNYNLEAIISSDIPDGNSANDSANININLDTDGDGVADKDDVDADNDGILDVDESKNCSLTYVTTVDAYWPLDGNTDDATTNANNENGNASVTYTTDAKQGANAVDFGSSSPIKYSFNDAFMEKPFSQMSFSAWIKPSAITGNQIIYEEGGTTNGVALWLNANTLTFSARYNGTQKDVTHPNPVKVGEWQHIATTFDNGQLVVYLNGVASSPVTASISSIGNHNEGGIGGNFNNNAANISGNFTGLMDAVRYSNSTAFSPAEIATESIGCDADGDGIANRLDLDSDGDGCSDANEYYGTDNADGNLSGNDDLQYGNSTNLTVDVNGRVNQAGYNGSGIDAVRDETIFSACSNNTFNVSEIWTNYDGLWNSSSTSINPIQPDNSHELLAFKYNGINYSTGVNDQKLTNNGINFSAKKYRALPVATLPISGSSSYFIGLGQLADGINNGTDNGSTNPFEASPASPLNGTEIASFLTDGIQGLDLGTNATNIPGGTESRFNLSTAGITASEVGDGVPDILITQTAQPNSNTDELEFIDASGATVGNVVQLDITQEPKVGEWMLDFYEFDSTGAANQFINTPRGIYLYGVDLADFGITNSNAGDAAALLYRPNGSSDVSFIAFNEPSLGVATQLTEISAANTEQNCDGTIPNTIQIQLADRNGNAVAQSGLAIEASLESGPGSLAGTTTQFTDGSGTATFNDLEFTTGGNHKIKFSFAGLDDAITANIGNATGCDSYTWTGATNSDWDEPGNWTTTGTAGGFPDGNNAVSIPDVSSGSNRYPILDADAGTGDLTMAIAASIDLNGFELALNGALTDVVSGASIDASDPGSNLFISSAGAANLPAGFISNDVANFTVENGTGATINSIMNITEVLSVRQGTLTTNSNITMKCFFDNEPNNGDLRRTAQIDEVGGTISGDVTVEQCFPGRRAFRYVSASTNGGSIHDQWQEGATAYNDNPKPGYGTHITGLGSVSGSGHSSTNPSSDQFQGLDWQPSGNPSMYSWNPSQAWDSVLNTKTQTLTAGDAYIMTIRGSRAIDLTSNTTMPDNTRLRSTGTVKQGNVTVTPGISNNQFTLIGNPYHAAVDMFKVLNPNSGYNNFIYVFDPNLGGSGNTNPNSNDLGGRGGYVTVNVTNSNTSLQSGITGVTATEANKFLQPYQSVFVQAAPSVSPGDITFKESYKSVNETQVDVFNTNPQPHIFVNLFDEASFNNLSSPDDGLVIYFSPNSSNAVNANDAVKLLNSDESIARIQNNNKISFENRALPQDNEVLELFTDQYRTTNYKLEIGVNEFPDKDVYLYDNYLDIEVTLNNDDNYIYSFTVDQSNPESVATDRFEIRFENTTLGINDFDEAGIAVYPNPVQDKVTFNLSQLDETVKDLSVCDISGRLINDYTVDNQENYEFSMSNYPGGLYIVKIETETGVLQHKLIKE